VHQTMTATVKPQRPAVTMAAQRPPDGGPRRRIDGRTSLIAISVAVSFVGCALYYLSAGQAAGRVWETTIASLLGLMIVGIVFYQAGRRAPWIAIWAGLTCAFVGGILAAHPTLSPFSVASPSFVDVFRLVNYPLGAVGVLVIVFRTDVRIGWRTSLESSILFGAGATIIWTSFLAPVVNTSEVGTLAGFVALLYPIMDLLLLAVLVAVVMHLNRRPVPVLLIVAALAGNLVADVAFGVQNLGGDYAPGTAIDLGWLLCFAAFAIAPAWPVSRSPELVDDDGRLGPIRLALLLAGAILIPGLTVIDTLFGDQNDPALAVSGLALTSLALGRMTIFNRDLDKGRADATGLAAALAVNNDELAKARAEQRQLLDRVHRLIEQERTRIAAELHDRPLQNLVSVGYQLEHLTLLIGRGDTDAALGIADRAAAALAVQLGELRDLMTEIRPPVLDESGLTGALADRANSLQIEHPELSITVEGDCGRVSTDLETTLYRIAQEALTNVVRHAAATSTSIDIGRAGDNVTLCCSDDGVGFDTTQIDRFIGDNHFGLAGMRERIELLGGSFAIDSSPDGTTLTLTAPIEEPKETST
ncbi:MAG: sensor histidine kinase, partial [Acidimicrobiales bacterium]